MTLYLNYWTLISFSLLITTSPYWPHMPSWHFALFPLAVLLASLKYRKARYGAGLALACVVILAHGNLLRYQTEMLFQSGQDITITADVDSLFKPINYGFQGIVIVRSINGQALTSLARPTIRLKGPQLLKPGDEISAAVKVNAIYGVLNEVGFDAETLALARSIVASAAINPKQSYSIISSGSIRGQLINKVTERLSTLENKGMILALLFGVRDDIPAQLWQQLKQSGLTHLISISGLHIGIAFAIGWSLGRIAMRIHFSMHFAPVFFGLLLATGYAWLAGFSIPTQRALLMCGLLCVIQYRAGSVPKRYKWLIVLAVLLALAPFSVVSMSLWMSMYAVAVMMFTLSVIARSQNRLMALVKMQLAIVLAMAPLVVYLFQGFSLGSLGYNLLFVPWFSLLVMPLAFVCLSLLLVGDVAQWLWLALDWSLQPLNWAISYSHWGWIELSHTQLKWLLLGVILLFSLWLIRRRALLLVTSIVVLSNVEWREGPVWQLTILDVGHGLAVVVEQGDQALVYDTGGAWASSSIVKQIVSPYLIINGIERVEYLIISHFDHDHAGGWQDMVARWQPRVVISSQLVANSSKCVAGKKWQWQQIEIEAVWPPNMVERAYNAHSCVVRLSHTLLDSSALLVGDIESLSEWLLLREPSKLVADVMTVPHHGSNTSSTAAFIAAVSADTAIASTAKNSRWNLPSPKVVNRYEIAGTQWLDTGSDGQVTVKFYPNRTLVSALRQVKGETWYRQMLRKGVE